MKKYIVDVVVAFLFCSVLALGAIGAMMNSKLQENYETINVLRFDLDQVVTQRDMGIKENEKLKFEFAELGAAKQALSKRLADLLQEKKELQAELGAANQVSFSLDKRLTESLQANNDLWQGSSQLARALSQKTTQANNAAAIISFQEELTRSLENMLIGLDVPKSKVTIKTVFIVPAGQVFQPGDKEVVARSLKLVQKMYYSELGITFAIGEQVVVNSQHDLSYYFSFPGKEGLLFEAVYSELKALRAENTYFVVFISGWDYFASFGQKGEMALISEWHKSPASGGALSWGRYVLTGNLAHEIGHIMDLTLHSQGGIMAKVGAERTIRGGEEMLNKIPFAPSFFPETIFLPAEREVLRNFLGK